MFNGLLAAVFLVFSCYVSAAERSILSAIEIGSKGIKAIAVE